LLAETLSTYLPGLTLAPQAFGGTPSGINWVHANDHFVCRSAHSVPLLAFSDYEGRHDEKEGEQALASLSSQVCSHLAWRFREWYRCPRLLAAVACPPFKEMAKIMMDTAAAAAANNDNLVGRLSSSSNDDSRRPFVLYSCHDVTLLALLYAIGADFLVSGEDCGGLDMQEEGGEGEVIEDMMNAGFVRKSWRWWPAYSSTIAFELVRLDHDSQWASSPGMVDQYAIRVILNGETLRLIPRMSLEDEGLLKEQPLSSRRVFGGMREDGKGHDMMKLSDFEHVIRVLEEAGGGGFSSVEEDKSELKEMDKIGVDGG
ncbi:hypothetical protein ACHAXR_006503, partial [Thalassiosira sp. AJA248-18]